MKSLISVLLLLSFMLMLMIPFIFSDDGVLVDAEEVKNVSHSWYLKANTNLDNGN